MATFVNGVTIGTAPTKIRPADGVLPGATTGWYAAGPILLLPMKFALPNATRGIRRTLTGRLEFALPELQRLIPSD